VYSPYRFLCAERTAFVTLFQICCLYRFLFIFVLFCFCHVRKTGLVTLHFRATQALSQKLQMGKVLRLGQSYAIFKFNLSSLCYQRRWLVVCIGDHTLPDSHRAPIFVRQLPSRISNGIWGRGDTLTVFSLYVAKSAKWCVILSQSLLISNKKSYTSHYVSIDVNNIKWPWTNIYRIYMYYKILLDARFPCVSRASCGLQYHFNSELSFMIGWKWLIDIVFV